MYLWILQIAAIASRQNYCIIYCLPQLDTRSKADPTGKLLTSFNESFSTLQVLFDDSASLLFWVSLSLVHCEEFCSQWFSCSAVSSINMDSAASRNLRSKDNWHDTESNTKLLTNTALSTTDCAKQGWKASCSLLGTSTSAKSFLGLSDCLAEPRNTMGGCWVMLPGYDPMLKIQWKRTASLFRVFLLSFLWLLCCAYTVLNGKQSTSFFHWTSKLLWFGTFFAPSCILWRCFTALACQQLQFITS